MFRAVNQISHSQPFLQVLLPSPCDASNSLCIVTLARGGPTLVQRPQWEVRLPLRSWWMCGSRRREWMGSGIFRPQRYASSKALTHRNLKIMPNSLLQLWEPGQIKDSHHARRGEKHTRTHTCSHSGASRHSWEEWHHLKTTEHSSLSSQRLSLDLKGLTLVSTLGISICFPKFPPWLGLLGQYGV